MYSRTQSIITILTINSHVHAVQFYSSVSGRTSVGGKWNLIGPALDLTKLSDEYVDKLIFTGTMVGLCVKDLQSSNIFDGFEYFRLE